MKDTAAKIAAYADALYPLLFIRDSDFCAVDELIMSIAENVRCYEYSPALGAVDFKTGALLQKCSLKSFLQICRDMALPKAQGQSGTSVYVILKDTADLLKDPECASLLRVIAEDQLYRDGVHITVFILGENTEIPASLESYTTVIDLPLPDQDEIRRIITDFAADLKFVIDRDTLNNITLSLKGLNSFQIRQLLNLVYGDGGSISKSDRQMILLAKEQYIKKSGLLELINFKESVDDIGGLSELKRWLADKAVIFNDLDRAIKFGADIPKGVMIVGMPGCGKSMTAKAAARLFNIPLVRLDVGRLFGKYVGESEENMRKALKLAEAISPCVLWIDEIEKAFAGLGGSGSGNEVTTRLFGHFLTWMQEKDNSVFIIATANDISSMPPEFLRKGRFDEIFFVDLPDGEERCRILEIHMRKRGKWRRDIDFISLIPLTEGFNGADLESTVKTAVERAFINGMQPIGTAELKEAAESTLSVSVTMGDKLQLLRDIVSTMGLRPAGGRMTSVSVKKNVLRAESVTFRADHEHEAAPPADHSAEKSKKANIQPYTKNEEDDSFFSVHFPFRSGKKEVNDKNDSDKGDGGMFSLFRKSVQTVSDRMKNDDAKSADKEKAESSNK